MYRSSLLFFRMFLYSVNFRDSCQPEKKENSFTGSNITQCTNVSETTPPTRPHIVVFFEENQMVGTTKFCIVFPWLIDFEKIVISFNLVQNKPSVDFFSECWIPSVSR